MLSIILSFASIFILGNIFASVKAKNLYPKILEYLISINANDFIEPKLLARNILNIPKNEKVMQFHRKQIRENCRAFYEVQAKQCNLKTNDKFVFWRKNQGFKIATLESLKKEIPECQKMTNEDIFSDMLQDTN